MVDHSGCCGSIIPVLTTFTPATTAGSIPSYALTNLASCSIAGVIPSPPEGTGSRTRPKRIITNSPSLDMLLDTTIRTK